MANELVTVFTDENTAQNAVNSQNMHFIMPSMSCLKKNYMNRVDAQRRQITIDAGSYFKMVIGGVHKCVKMVSDFTFDPQNYHDLGTTFQSGKDYYVYLVNTSSGASIVVSLNATYPDGTSADTTRRIGGFHTLCGDAGVIANHPLSVYLAGDILPASVWDLRHGPSCEPIGMVFAPGSNNWVDIYVQSGSGSLTKSAFGGTVTKSQAYDVHLEDFRAVGKTACDDATFGCAAYGTPSGASIAPASDPITTGNHKNSAGVRIISAIGCEDMAGVYWHWLNDAGYTSENIVVVGGGTWGGGASSGPRSRSIGARSHVGAAYSSRGCAQDVARA